MSRCRATTIVENGGDDMILLLLVYRMQAMRWVNKKTKNRGEEDDGWSSIERTKQIDPKK